MNLSKFTGYWNLARIMAIVFAFGIIGLCRVFPIGGGFSPSLDIANTQDRAHRDLHETDRERQNQEAHNRCEEARSRDEKPDDRDMIRDAEYNRDHAV